jgi:hypothetical protein
MKKTLALVGMVEGLKKFKLKLISRSPLLMLFFVLFYQQPQPSQPPFVITLPNDPGALITIVVSIVGTFLVIIKMLASYYVDKGRSESNNSTQLIRAIYNLAENLGKANELAAKDRERANVERLDLIDAVQTGNKAVTAMELKLGGIEKLTNDLTSSVLDRLVDLEKDLMSETGLFKSETRNTLREIDSLRRAIETGFKQVNMEIDNICKQAGVQSPTELNATVTIVADEKDK